MAAHPTLLAPLLLFALLSGCAGTPAPDPAGAGTNPLALGDGAWRLAGYGPAEAPEEPHPDATVTLQVDAAAEQFSGSAGCNQYTAPYTRDGETLAVGDVVATKKYCQDPDGIMEQESTYLSALGAVTRYGRESDHLLLHYGEGAVLVFTVAGDGSPARDGA